MSRRALCVLLSLLLALSGLLTALAEASAPDGAIVGLETCGLVNPLGIDVEVPVFDWRMESERVGASQTAYQIVVKDDGDHTVWDSGVVEGRPLHGDCLRGRGAEAPDPLQLDRGRDRREGPDAHLRGRVV